jgi:hypothetical protein
MLKVESEREEDGRWIAEVPALPGVLLRLRIRVHDGDEIGPRMLARMARHIGLRPEDL